MSELSKISLGDRLTPEEAQNRYNVRKDAYYTRLKVLGIKHKKEGNFYYLDFDQICQLDKLHYWLLNGGNLQDYDPTAETSSLTTVNSNSSVAVKSSHKNSADKVLDSVDTTEIDLAHRLDRSAQAVAAGILAEARNRLTAEYLQNPDSLHEELQNKVFLAPDPTAIDLDWAGRHMEAAIKSCLQAVEPQNYES